MTIILEDHEFTVNGRRYLVDAVERTAPLTGLKAIEVTLWSVGKSVLSHPCLLGEALYNPETHDVYNIHAYENAWHAWPFPWSNASVEIKLALCGPDKPTNEAQLDMFGKELKS